MEEVDVSKKPKVTVIIPIYNAERFLEEALESVLAQDLADIEVICIDDGSTDKSREIIEKYCILDARARRIYQKRKGVGAARNAGIEAARGEFLAFLDADDWYDGISYLRTLYEGASQSKQLVAAACFANYRSSDDIETDFSNSAYYEGYSFPESKVTSYKDYQFDYGFHRFIFSIRLFEGGANRFSGLTYYEDPIFLVRILDQAGSFFAVSDARYMYRCDYKRTHWDTDRVISLLEGVRSNLLFSLERGYDKLHWYTVHHLDSESGDVGIGVNRKLDLVAVDRSLREVERLIDYDRLASCCISDSAFVPAMRKAFSEASSRNIASTVKATTEYWWHHR